MLSLGNEMSQDLGGKGTGRRKGRATKKEKDKRIILQRRKIGEGLVSIMP